MKRRTFVAAAGALALAGCSTTTGGQRTETETDRPWPAESDGSTVEPVGDRSRAGHRYTDELTSKVVTKSGTVEIVSAIAAREVGVTTVETDGNPEAIHESEFDWYQAPEGSWMWFIRLNLLERSSESELPPTENWRVQPVLETRDETPKLSITSTYDPDPTFVRYPLYYGGTSTSPVYGYEHDLTDIMTLVFEVRSDAVELLYGDPVEATWGFEIES